MSTSKSPDDIQPPDPTYEYIAPIHSTSINNGNQVYECMHPPRRPPSPEYKCVFDKWKRTKVGDRRVFWAMVKDPQLENARKDRHGVKDIYDSSAKDCISPSLLSPLQHRTTEEKERIYESNKTKPLGTYSKRNLPDFINPYKTTFGVPSKRGEGAGHLINPDSRRVDVLKREQEDRKEYMRPYLRVLPGEQAVRNYNEKFDKDMRFGIITRSDPSGVQTRCAMDWMSDKAQKMQVASERLFEYFDRMAYRTGRTRDPIRDTMHVSPDHTFGLPSVAGERSVMEYMHGCTPKNLLGLTAPKGRPLHEDESVQNRCTSLTSREAIIRAILKNLLRKKMYKRGPEITAVLCDIANGEEYISEAAAQAVYETFEPPLDDELRELLFDVVRGENYDKSGVESVIKPAVSREEAEEGPKIINWKLLASLLDYNRIQPHERQPQDYCMKEEPCVPQISECAEAVRTRLSKAVKARIKEFKTTSQQYNGDLNGLMNRELWRPLGFPSNQATSVIPFPPRLEDKRNFADLPSAHSLISPALMTCFDIRQWDMFVLRTKDEMKSILVGSGVDKELDEDYDFGQMWAMAKKRDAGRLSALAPGPEDDRATLDSFRDALRAFTREKITQKVHANFNPCCSANQLASRGYYPKRFE